MHIIQKENWIKLTSDFSPMLDARILSHNVLGTKIYNSKILQLFKILFQLEDIFHKLEDRFLTKQTNKQKSENIAVMFPSFHSQLKMENPGNQKLH